MASLRCYARGLDDEWEAICLDLDIAVQGHSLEEVKRLLNQSISSYLHDIQSESPADRKRLAHRRAPLSVQIGIQFEYLIYRLRRALRDDHDGHIGRQGYAFQCPS